MKKTQSCVMSERVVTTLWLFAAILQELVFAFSSKKTDTSTNYFMAIKKINLLFSDRIVVFSRSDDQQAEMISEDSSHMIKIMKTVGWPQISGRLKVTLHEVDAARVINLTPSLH